MIAIAAQRGDEAGMKKAFGVQHWIDDLPWLQANERLESQPTVHIEGLVGGYTGPGGKTVLPHRAVAKIDMRLVPDMKKDDGGRAESASRETRLRRPRSERHRRLRPDIDLRFRADHPIDDLRAETRRVRSRPLAAASTPATSSRIRP